MRSDYPLGVRIYTKRGDDGTTGLLFGGRISKADLAAEAYGTVDEAVAALGLVRAATEDGPVRALVLRLQRELFVVGADLATNPDERERLEPEVSLVTARMVEGLERVIDALVADHPLPREFVVPGANPVSAALDLARTSVRRAESRCVEMHESLRTGNGEVVRYMNRQ